MSDQVVSALIGAVVVCVGWVVTQVLTYWKEGKSWEREQRREAYIRALDLLSDLQTNINLYHSREYMIDLVKAEIGLKATGQREACRCWQVILSNIRQFLEQEEYCYDQMQSEIAYALEDENDARPNEVIEQEILRSYEELLLGNRLTAVEVKHYIDQFIALQREPKRWLSSIIFLGVKARISEASARSKA